MGWAAIVYKKLCSIKLVVGKNLIKHEKKKKNYPFFRDYWFFTKEN